jgi:outer membrane protein assembly factor BamB
MTKALTSVLTTFLLWTQTMPLQAQNLPKTNLVVFDMQRNGNNFSFSNGRMLTSFNQSGYNNQPHFVNNYEIYLTSQAANSPQSDIISLSLATGVKTAVTATPESEYSPTLTPDRRFFTVVRTDAGGEKRQRLWRYPVDRSTAGEAVLKYHTMVGYYTWLNNTQLACFMLEGAENYLALINTQNENSIRLANNIGRSLLRAPDGNLLFIHKGTPQTWFVKSLDPISNTSKIVIQTLPNSEDIVCLPDGTLIATSGSKLYAYTMSQGNQNWREIANFAEYGLNSLKRLAINKDLDKIVIVNDNSGL